MAGPACQSGDGNAAVFVGTMLSTGDGYALCDECLASWAIALVATMTGIDPAPFILAISDDGQVAGVEHGAPSDEPPPPAPADSDPTTRSGPADPHATEPPDSASKGRKRARSASGRMSGESPGPGTDADPGVNGAATRAENATPAA